MLQFGKLEMTLEKTGTTYNLESREYIAIQCITTRFFISRGSIPLAEAQFCKKKKNEKKVI